MCFRRRERLVVVDHQRDTVGQAPPLPPPEFKSAVEDEDAEVAVKTSKNDPIKTETLNILCDLISLSVPVKVETASVVK
jgi:hypothetical protein